MKINHYWFKEAKIALKKAWKHRNQMTWCFCPVCKQDLCSTDSFVSDTGHGKDNRVTYKCSRCGAKSTWNFDVFMGGFLMSSQQLTVDELKQI